MQLNNRCISNRFLYNFLNLLIHIKVRQITIRRTHKYGWNVENQTDQQDGIYKGSRHDFYKHISIWINKELTHDLRENNDPNHNAQYHDEINISERIANVSE